MSKTVRIIYQVVDKATTKLGRIANSIKGVGTSSKTASIAMAGLGTVAKTASGMIVSYLAIRATQAVVNFAKTSINAFADFEYAMADVAAKLGTTVGDITELSETAKRLGVNYGIGSKEAARGLVSFAAAGFDAAESAKALDATIKLAIITNTDMEQSALLIVQALSVFGAKASETTKYVDALVAADLASTASATDLALALGYAGASATSMGLDVYDTLTIIAALSDRVGGAAKAGRYFDAMLREMRTKSKQLGVEIYTTDGRLKDFGDIITSVSSKMEGMTVEQKNAWLTSIGFSSQAMRAILTLANMGSTAEETGEMIRSLNDEVRETGGASTAVDTKMNTLTGSMNKFKAAVEGLQIALVEGLAPALTGVLDKATNFIGAITKAQERINKLNKYMKEHPQPSWFWKPAEYKQWGEDLEAFTESLKKVAEEVTDEIDEIGEAFVDIAEPLESAIDEINRLIREGLLGDAQGKFKEFASCTTDKAGQMALGIQDDIWDLVVSTEEGYARLLAMAEKMPEGPGKRAAIQRAETYRAAGYERIEALEGMLSTLLTTGTIPTAATPDIPMQNGDVVIDMDINMFGIDPDAIDYDAMSRQISDELLQKLIDAGVVGDH